ncbi:MAG: hypothetical protein M3N59_02035 [bacterium]|nr:hypothetical protein [bacterium]
MKLIEPHFDKLIGTYPDFWDSKETPREFYDRTYETIKDCDLFIAEISKSSVGVGMEMQMGQQYSIPVIALCKSGVDPSPMSLGLPMLKRVIKYKNLSDLDKQLLAAIEDYKAGKL